MAGAGLVPYGHPRSLPGPKSARCHLELSDPHHTAGHPLNICKADVDMTVLSPGERVALKAELRKRIDGKLAQRFFYALYPDGDAAWGAAANKHFNSGSAR